METQKVIIQIKGINFDASIETILITVEIPKNVEAFEYINEEENYQRIIVKPHFNIDFETIIGFQIINKTYKVPQLKESKKLKSYLFENGGEKMLSEKTKNWMNGIDESTIIINTETHRDYMKEDDLFMFALLIDPNLVNIITSSCFITTMPYNAYQLHGKEYDINDEKGFTQLDYFSYLIYNTVSFREKSKMIPLTIHLNYESENFLSNLNLGRFGKDVKQNLKLMLRKSEGFIKLKLFEEYKFIKDLITEEDLNE